MPQCVFTAVPARTITIFGYNRTALSCHLKHLQKLVSCNMCVCVCVLGGRAEGGCMHV